MILSGSDVRKRIGFLQSGHGALTGDLSVSSVVASIQSAT
jgi:hypothetical protein